MIEYLEKKLEKSQWNSLDLNAQIQKRSLQNILKHAYETVPFYQKYYREFCGAHPNWETIAKNLSALPILSRALVKSAEKNLVSERIPTAHGACHTLETSGSTGSAVKILGTELTNIFYHAVSLREHSWHHRDFTKTLLAIGWLKKDFAPAPMGLYQKTWGPPIDWYKTTGPGILMNIASSTESQIEGLLHYKPHYLISYPSQIVELASFASKEKLDFSFLEEIRTTGETFTESYRNIIRNAFQHVKLTDIYSCVEIGNLASQCGEQGNYHVTTENVYIEIVDNENKPCGIGEPGKILFTSLLNYATPLIRYEIGDYGAWGEPCSCGRGFPVIKKIFGRTRNRLKLPNGTSRFPYLGEREDYRKITTDVIKFQFIQHTVYELEYKMVLKNPITLQQEVALKELLKKNFGAHFNVKITSCESISSGPTAKYEEFISYVS